MVEIMMCILSVFLGNIDNTQVQAAKSHITRLIDKNKQMMSDSESEDIAALGQHYTNILQERLQKLSNQTIKQQRKKFLSWVTKKNQSVVIEIGLDNAGRVLSEAIGVSSGREPLDDYIRVLLLQGDPFPPVVNQLLSTNGCLTCLARFVLRWERKSVFLSSSLACFLPEQSIAIVSDILDENDITDAGGMLFKGWQYDINRNKQAALQLYRAAFKLAPEWDLAARALGLALVKNKRAKQAIPYLKVYYERRKGASDALSYEREIHAFERKQAARIAEANRVRSRLSKKDIAWGIKKGYALLEPCLKAARSDYLLQEKVDTIHLSWEIEKDGVPRNVELEGPSTLLMTKHETCLEKAVMRWQFPKYSAGSDVAVNNVPLKVRGSPPMSGKGSATKQASIDSKTVLAKEIAEPMFATCERSSEEIQDFIRLKFMKVRKCVMHEKQRAPNAPLPQTLPISFVVDANGPVRNVLVDHRAYRQGPLQDCMVKAVQGQLAASDGADCPAEFGLDLSQLMPHMSL